MIDKSKTIKTAGEDNQIECLSELAFYAPAVHGNYKVQADGGMGRRIKEKVSSISWIAI